MLIYAHSSSKIHRGQHKHWYLDFLTVSHRGGSLLLLKVNEVFFQYSDGGRRKGLPMAPLSPRDGHVMPRGVVYFQSAMLLALLIYLYLLALVPVVTSASIGSKLTADVIGK